MYYREINAIGFQLKNPFSKVSEVRWVILKRWRIVNLGLIWRRITNYSINKIEGWKNKQD